MITSRRDVLRGFAGSAALSAPFLLSDCSPEPKRPGSKRPLSLQASWANDAEFIGYFVAIVKGCYDVAGLAFDYLPGGPETVSDEVLAKRQCDVALTNIDGTVDAILNQGAPFKIIGTQYQKSPLGIVSLANKNIHSPKDLIGKRLAVPDANKTTTAAFLKLNGVDPDKVEIVNYLYNPDILVKGTVDATVDFVTNVPYAIRLEGATPSSFLFADFKFEMFMDTVVVREETLKAKRQELIAFLRASRKGWEENFKDVKAYPEQFKDSFYKDNGRAVENEQYFNEQQRPLIESPLGIFSMSAEGIEQTREALARIGLKAPAGIFVTDLLKEL